jgi:DNA-binding response OmpR family regulator
MVMKILLAEDDRNFGVVMKGELEEDGNDVDLARDGVEAVLKFLDNRDYDFVLFDIKMPRLDGIDALRIIKKINRRVPAITFSGNAGSGEMAESVRAGALRCLAKPFNVGQLMEELRAYSRRHAREKVR